MGSYAQALQNSTNLQQMQRQQAIQQNQAASLGIAHVLTSGIHPDTGEALTPQEKIQLAQKNKELQGQLQDLWNPRQKVGDIGHNLAVASGVQMPETTLHKVGDFLHLTQPPVTAPGAKTPQQQMQDLRDITQKYQPLPGQPEAEAATFALKSHLRDIDNMPDLTDEQKQEASAHALGLPFSGSFKPPVTLTLGDGRTMSAQQSAKDGRWYDLNRKPIDPDLLTGATAQGKETSDTRARSDFAEFKKTSPNFTGTFEQWKKQQSTGQGFKFDPNTGQVTEPATGKRYSRNDQGLPPEVGAIFASQKETAAEKQQNALSLAYARGMSLGAGRIIQVLDPTNPGAVNYMRAGDAIKSGAQSPSGIAFQIDKAMEKALTSGNMGQNIIAFNTANSHLDLLQQAADALNNGDSQFVNRTANQFITQFGSPAPSNFNAIKAAVSGELAKTFRGSGVTDQDIAAISGIINDAQSPAQIQGAISYYRSLMKSKVQAVANQGKSVRQELANSLNKGQSKGARSLAAAMALDVNKGKTEAQVESHLKELGYTVTRP
jgi:hypothetical protein